MNTSPEDPQGTPEQEPTTPEEAPSALDQESSAPDRAPTPGPFVPPQPYAAQQTFAAGSPGSPSGVPDAAWPAPGAPSAGAATSWPPADVATPHRPSRSRRWMPLVATAAAAAVLASVGTVGLLHAVDGTDTALGTSVSIASLGATTSATVPVSGSTSDNPDWEAVAAAVRPSVVAIDVQLQNGSAKGSGVIVDSAGNIITNNHVVADATADGITVTLSDGRVYRATVVGTDATTDLAVVALTDPPTDLTPAVLAESSSVQVGAPVMAVGNPLGLDSTVTTGIVSAVDRPVSTSDGSDTAVTNAIQIDAAINPGNSGGPLFDASGKVIGITSSIASLSSGSSSGSIGLGFAIPTDLVDRVAAELVATGTAEHAYLGVTLSDGTASVEGTTRRGAEIRSVSTGTPAADAGLRAGDVVVAIGSDPVNGAESLTAFVREQAAGSTATLTVVRSGAAVSIDVTFAALSQAQPASGSGQGDSGQNGGSDPNGVPSQPFPWGQQG